MTKKAHMGSRLRKLPMVDGHKPFCSWEKDDLKITVNGCAIQSGREAMAGVGAQP
jgi:hypothetical protein